MTNYINYYSHTTQAPPYYERNYERDLPEVDKPDWLAGAKRAALLALPFLSLHKPLGSAISFVMGSARCATHLAGTIEAMRKGESKHISLEMVQLSLATMALAGSVFQFTLGLALTTGQECLFTSAESVQHLAAGEYEKAGEGLLQGVSSGFYLAIMFTGSLEITLISLSLQALLSFYQARKELAQGKYPEAAAKMAMGLIRCHQAHSTLAMIQRRNYLCEINKQFEQLLARAQNGKKVDHLWDNPLTDLDEQIEKKSVTLTDAKDKEYDFGSHFHGYGKGTVKGANLSLRTEVIEGKTVTELDFKVNHVFRDRLEILIKDLQSIKGDDLRFLLAASNSHTQGIKITKEPYNISPTLKMGEAYKIAFEGLGTLYVGSSKLTPNLYDRVIVRMDAGKNLYDLHEILSFVKLDDAVRMSAAEDIERIKIGQLFRTFCPKEATPFERTETFFQLPIEELRQEIIKRAPSMKGIFDQHLAKMEAREILPGRVRYGIDGLAEEVRSQGARALIAAVTGAYTDAELFSRVASMIKMGMISSEMRYTNGIAASGLSPSADFYTGGADSVYTQMLTDKSVQSQMPLDYLYHSRVRIVLSLDALETGTYQYHNDCFGTRSLNSFYPYRPGILDFVRNLSLFSFGHEVMIKERVPPSLFKEFIVPDTQTRDNLLAYLRGCHLVQKDTKGTEQILGIDALRFIRVGKNVTEELLS